VPHAPTEFTPGTRELPGSKIESPNRYNENAGLVPPGRDRFGIRCCAGDAPAPAPSNVPDSPDDGLVNVLAAATPRALAVLPPQAVTRVQAASSSVGLPGAAIVNVLSMQGMTSKATAALPLLSTIITVGDSGNSLFGQYGQADGSSLDRVWQVQALVQPSATDTWQTGAESLDPSSLPWWDTPASF